MASPRSGAQNKLYIFRVKDTGSAYEIRNAAGSAAATATADALHVFDLMTEVKPTPQDDGTLKVDLEQYEDSPDLDAVLEEFAVVTKSSGGSSLPELVYQNGDKHTPGGSSSGDVLLLVYPGVGDPDVEKVKCWIALVNMNKTSGGSSDKYEDYTKPVIGFSSFFGKYDLTVSDFCFTTDIFTTPSSESLPKTRAFIRKWKTVPAF
jgi:hypothetical protein